MVYLKLRNFNQCHSSTFNNFFKISILKAISNTKLALYMENGQSKFTVVSTQNTDLFLYYRLFICNCIFHINNSQPAFSHPCMCLLICNMRKPVFLKQFSTRLI